MTPGCSLCSARMVGVFEQTRHPGHKSHGWGAACLHVALVYGMGALALAWTQASAGKEPQWSLFAGRVCNEYVVTTATGVLFAWQAFATIVAHMTNEPFPIVWQVQNPPAPTQTVRIQDLEQYKTTGCTH